MTTIYKALLLALFAFLLLSNANVSLVSAEPVQTIINYDLAYPGILPDNPLYKLKVLRDKITILLINDPLKKIDFYLLQTDKGILATAMLVDKNKISLAEETALKAEHNYTLLIDEFRKIHDRPDASFFQKLKTASLKHQEVLESLIKRVPENKQKTFKTVIYFAKRNLDQVNRLQNKSFPNE